MESALIGDCLEGINLALLVNIIWDESNDAKASIIAKLFKLAWYSAWNLTVRSHTDLLLLNK